MSTVVSGIRVQVGTTESLVVEPGGKAKLHGRCSGDARNGGGDLTVLRGAVIEGTLPGREHIRVDPGAEIDNAPLIFEGGDSVVRVAIRDDGTIAGLYIVADHSAAASDPSGM